MKKTDINDFYIREHICVECGNICSRSAQTCPECGSDEIVEVIACRSCLEYHICANCDSDYASHVEDAVCPECGQKTRTCCMMIPEDHWGLPIPSSDDCSGELRDDDEGYETPRRLKKTIRRHEDD